MKRGLLADPSDNVGVVLETVGSGELVDFGSCIVTAADEIHMPHKIALVSLKKGAPVRKFGGIIGYAAREIRAGAWVHAHNLISGTKGEGRS